MKTTLLIFALVACTSIVYAQADFAAVSNDMLAMNIKPVSTVSTFTSPTPAKVRRTTTTEAEVAPEDKKYITAGIFPSHPAPGGLFWLEYGLPNTEDVAIELFDQQGFSYVLCSGKREAGVRVEALRIPSHLESGTYYLKIRAGNGRSVVPVTVK